MSHFAPVLPPVPASVYIYMIIYSNFENIVNFYTVLCKMFEVAVRGWLFISGLDVSICAYDEIETPSPPRVLAVFVWVALRQNGPLHIKICSKKSELDSTK